MNRTSFDALVQQAFAGLPAALRARIDNVVLEVRTRPSRQQLRDAEIGPEDTLFGLYEGTPLTERAPDFALQMPDRIFIFQEPIERECATSAEIIHEIQITVIHEFGHYFGLSDEEMDCLEDGCHGGPAA